MTKTTFLRAVDHAPEEKGYELARLTGALRTKESAEGLDSIFVADGRLAES